MLHPDACTAVALCGSEGLTSINENEEIKLTILDTEYCNHKQNLMLQSDWYSLGSSFNLDSIWENWQLFLLPHDFKGGIKSVCQNIGLTIETNQIYKIIIQSIDSGVELSFIELIDLKDDD